MSSSQVLSEALSIPNKINHFSLNDKNNYQEISNLILEKKDNILLINGGVSGDTTAGGLSRIDWSITDDINAVAISLGANDTIINSRNHASERNNLCERRRNCFYFI